MTDTSITAAEVEKTDWRKRIFIAGACLGVGALIVAAFFVKPPLGETRSSYRDSDSKGVSITADSMSIEQIAQQDFRANVTPGKTTVWETPYRTTGTADSHVSLGLNVGDADLRFNDGVQNGRIWASDVLVSIAFNPASADPASAQTVYEGTLYDLSQNRISPDSVIPGNSEGTFVTTITTPSTVNWAGTGIAVSGSLVIDQSQVIDGTSDLRAGSFEMPYTGKAGTDDEYVTKTFHQPRGYFTYTPGS
ncbi:hypothetical protein [Microbacterium binotii]|uniref:Uncharacterized protein n=1 Tax=Microbacterium binotii TaxID=462710 RepID=A0ABN3P7Y5_9MICO